MADLGVCLKKRDEAIGEPDEVNELRIAELQAKVAKAKAARATTSAYNAA